MPSNPVFDETYWQKVIKQPDWYRDFVPYALEVSQELQDEPEEFDRFKKQTRHFFEKALQEGVVALATSGPNLDKQRIPIDTIVIHHTSHTPGYRLSYMEATQLLNIYAPYYMNPTVKEERGLAGKAVWSGHFRNGRQTFLAYHWLMRMDGSFEQLLQDNQIGWHAGNWEINKKSIGIFLDNDYESQDPTDEILQKLAVHIKKHYPNIQPANIMGHCEARVVTICPGSNFLNGWKPKLIKLLA